MTLDLCWLENCLYYDSRVVIYDRKNVFKIGPRDAPMEKDKLSKNKEYFVQWPIL